MSCSLCHAPHSLFPQNSLFPQCSMQALPVYSTLRRKQVATSVCSLPSCGSAVLLPAGSSPSRGNPVLHSSAQSSLTQGSFPQLRCRAGLHPCLHFWLLTPLMCWSTFACPPRPKSKTQELGGRTTAPTLDRT